MPDTQTQFNALWELERLQSESYERLAGIDRQLRFLREDRRREAEIHARIKVQIAAMRGQSK